MLLLIAIGYLHMLFYTLIIFCLSFNIIFFCTYQQRNWQEENGQSAQPLQSTENIKIGYTNDITCAICLSVYKPEDEIH